MSVGAFPYGCMSMMGGVVTISAATVSAFSFGTNATANYKVQTDGTIDRQLNGGSDVQINTATDWIRPTAAASSDYEVRHQSQTGDTSSYTGDLTSTWQDMSQQRNGQVLDATITAGGKSVTQTVEMRKNGGSVLSSATITISADREDF